MQQSVVEETVGAGYFAIAQRADAGRPGVRGARSTDRGRRIEDLALPVVLNETAAHRLFGNGNAIGKRVRDDKQSYEVVGVVRDLKNGIGISQSVVYLPLTPRNFARPPAGGITIMVRSDAGADALSGIRSEIASIDPNLTVFNVRTLSDYLERSRSSMRFAAHPTAELECSAWCWPQSDSPE